MICSDSRASGLLATRMLLLFEHHIAFGQHVFVLEDEAGHAVASNSIILPSCSRGTRWK